MCKGGGVAGEAEHSTSREVSGLAVELQVVGLASSARPPLCRLLECRLER